MSGAGNDFVVLDGRSVDVSGLRQPERIAELCREYKTDGLMILLEGTGPSGGAADFRMEFYNPDGSGGMMCGNGGRCIVAFADRLGIRPSAPDRYTFLAPDGLHTAEILSRPRSSCGTTSTTATEVWTVKLEMIDVEGVSEVLGGYFLNTGTRHFVKFVDDVDAIDVEKEGKELRWNKAFAPEGANVNFVQILAGGTLKVRTFEKGVEGETLACGTGITASAIAAYYAGRLPVTPASAKERTEVKLLARRGDMLKVDFVPSETDPASFGSVHLTGPAEFC
jgi:diaminopimelate epimerase